LEVVKRQTLDIARQEAERRRELPQASFKVIDFREVMSKPIPPRKQPLRAWAELAAPLIDKSEWDDIVYFCDDEVRPFRGNVIRFFETAFESLRLKDGTLIVP
jgi:hypothetical protein